MQGRAAAYHKELNISERKYIIDSTSTISANEPLISPYCPEQLTPSPPRRPYRLRIAASSAMTVRMRSVGVRVRGIRASQRPRVFSVCKFVFAAQYDFPVHLLLLELAGIAPYNVQLI